MTHDKDHDDAIRALGGKVPERPQWEKFGIERLDYIETIETLRARIAELEAENERLRRLMVDDGTEAGEFYAKKIRALKDSR